MTQLGDDTVLTMNFALHNSQAIIAQLVSRQETLTGLSRMTDSGYYILRPASEGVAKCVSNGHR